MEESRFSLARGEEDIESWFRLFIEAWAFGAFLFLMDWLGFSLREAIWGGTTD